jgi:hypothetical protein
MLEIPVNPLISSDFSFTVSLENVFCKFRLMWNTKSQFWMVNTYEEPENGVIIHGLKIIPNYPFLFTYGPSFPGQLICLKVGNDTEEEITYNNFGTGWRLIYLDEDEFELWRLLSGF